MCVCVRACVRASVCIERETNKQKDREEKEGETYVI